MRRKVRGKIHKLMMDKGLPLRELSRRTDIRYAALSELANQKRQNINFSQIERIAESLEIDDICDIIDLEVTEE
ncbi:helix-turn-helix transcriptional regulator [Neobacillus sp. PS3-34]|uniref:helix-turn-helix domain-containing protein n=1 Tax=Neobacillus sp. PS3-34 TaxID=3070678 RepID=UPI0027E0A695|nr:helix-turn-helix transcriptional regulator [Neobacillus sp. PS3-34]WML46687.1 helix-turn-helix transcriptional regulator [Neobacillus sp. PS3-34]